MKNPNIKSETKDTASREVFLPWIIERRHTIFFIFFGIFMFLLLINQGGANDLRRAPIWALRGTAFLGFLFFYLIEYARPDKKGLPTPFSRQPIFETITSCLLVFLAINIMTATSWQHALSESLNFMMILAIVSLVAFYATERKQIFTIVGILLVLGILASVEGLSTYIGDGQNNPLVSFFAWHNPAGGYLTTVLMIALALTFTRYLSGDMISDNGKKKWQSIRAWPVALLCAAALIFTLSRGAWISAFLAVLVLAILIGIKRAFDKKSMMITGLVVLVAIIAIGVIGGRSVLEPVYQRIISFTATKDFSFEGRQNFYNGAVKIFNDHMLTGVGLGSYGFIYPQYQQDPRFYARDPHSFYLRLLSEGGVFGILLIAMILWGYFHLIVRYVKNRNISIAGLSAGLIAALTAGLLHLAIDFDDTFPFILMNLAVIWVLALNLLDPVVIIETKEKTKDKKPVTRASMAVSSVLLTIVIFATVYYCGCLFYSETYYDNGKAISSTGNWEEAEKEFSRSLDYFKLNERSMIEKTRSLLLIADKTVSEKNADEKKVDDLITDAVITSKILKDVAPYNAKSFYWSGSSLSRSKNPNNLQYAAADFKQSLKLDPVNSPRAHLDMARSYVFMTALTEFNKTVSNFYKIYPFDKVEEFSRTRLDWTDLPDIYQDMLLIDYQVILMQGDLFKARDNLSKVIDLEEVRKNISGKSYSRREEVVDFAQSQIIKIDDEIVNQ